MIYWLVFLSGRYSRTLTCYYIIIFTTHAYDGLSCKFCTSVMNTDHPTDSRVKSWVLGISYIFYSELYGNSQDSMVKLDLEALVRLELRTVNQSKLQYRPYIFVQTTRSVGPLTSSPTSGPHTN
jgi:hypothetical protein